MDAQILPVTAAQPAPPPILQPDNRPTADAAALARDPRPDIPLPIPASIAQKGAVAQARIASAGIGPAQVERVLKPYGVVMLPQGPLDDPLTPTDQPADADAAAAADDPAMPPDDGTDGPARAGGADDGTRNGSDDATDRSDAA